MSYLRREDRRYAYVACGVGALMLAWHALSVPVVSAFVTLLLFLVFVVSYILSHFH